MSRLNSYSWLAAVAGVFLAYAGLITYCDFVKPEAPGVDIEPVAGRMVVSRVAPDSPSARAGVEAGDVLVAVNGRPIRTRTDWVAEAMHAQFGRPWHFDLERDGGRLEAVVPLERAGWRVSVAQSGWMLLFIRAMFLATLLLAVFIAFRRPRDPVALLGALLLASLSVFSVVWQYRIGSVWLSLPAAVGILLWVPSLLAWTIGCQLCAFYILFPTGRARPAWFWPAVVAPMAVAIGLHAPSQVALVYAPETATPPGWRAALLIAVNAAYIVVGLVALFRTYFRLTDVNEKRRTRLLAVGSAVAWAGGVVTTVHYLFFRSDPMQPLFASTTAVVGTMAFAVFPLSIAYAILKHRLFDLRVMVRLGARYALARGAFVSLVPALIALLAADLVRLGNQPLLDVLRVRAITYGLVAGLVAALYASRRRVLDAIDRHFFRERYDGRALLGHLAEDIRASGHLHRAAPRVVSQIESALHPHFAALLIRSPGEPEYGIAAVAPPGHDLKLPPASSTLMRLVRALNQTLDVSESHATWLRQRLPASELRLVGDARIDLIVPIVLSEAQTEALLVLGTKRSEEPYSGEDRDLLRTIAANLALLIERQAVPAPSADTSEECPTCGRCYDAGTGHCEHDDARLTLLSRPRVLGSRYRLDERLGQGGMGAVYRAFDTSLDRAVAIKVIREALMASADAADRFRREARLAARFTHPNVVTVHDFGVTDGRIAFLVMELLKGRTLREELSAQAHLSPGRALAVSADVASAIEAAHRQGLVHRDLKPENLFLVRDGSAEVAKVLDFGIAKSVAVPLDSPTTTGAQTTPGLLLGTPSYMAPEQLRQQAPSPSWDLWSFGLVVCEMLTGAHPLQLTLPGDIGGYEESVEAHLATWPPAWRAFFARALAVDVNRRPATPGQFLAELQAALAG